MKHVSIALFVPHAGCPHQCSFCNQKSISGSSAALTPADVASAAQKALENKNLQNAQIAFFGGSFTAIERNYMISLLEAAQEFIDGEKITGIRVSTRPDAVDDEICSILKRYKTQAVEIGAQSMDDAVLALNERGHTSADVEKSVKMLKAYGFETGVQMMTGLYGSSKEESVETAKKLIALRPDTVRIYPTVVLEGTRLFALYKSGLYHPQTVEQAVDICSEIIPLFYENNIKIIRVGLHSGGGVGEGFAAGAYHPALRELCESRIYYKKILSLLSSRPAGEKATVYVPQKDISQAVGHKKENIERLRALGMSVEIKGDPGLKKYETVI